MYCVYKHTCPNDKIYIGITGRNVIKRWNNGNGYRNNKHFYNAILKYGWNNIKHEIILDNLTKQEALIKEKELIAEYNSINRKYGYNNAEGGTIGPLGCKHTEEMNKRKSEYMKKHPNKGQFKKGNCNKPSTTFKKGNIPWNKGRKMTKEEIEKNRRSHLGQHSSPSTEFKPKIVLCIETGIIYNGAKEAGQINHINSNGICKVCRGEQKTAGNLHWKYL